MAVSKNGCGIKVELLINSNALVEFEDRSRRGEDRATTRYIPAAAGQEFTIAVEILPGFRFEGDCVESFIRNDFGRCAGMAIRKDAEVEKWESKGPQDSERKGGTCKQQYDFSLFETEHEEYQKKGREEREALKVQGKIRIECIHKMWGDASFATKSVSGITYADDIGFNPRYPSAEPNEYPSWNMSHAAVEGVSSPAATFVFYCRTPTFIESTDLTAASSPALAAARCPAPLALEKRKFAEIDEDDWKETHKQLSEFKKQRRAAARSRLVEDDDDNKPCHQPRKLGRRSTAASPPALEID